MPRVSPGTLTRTIQAVMLTDSDECIIWPHALSGVGYGQYKGMPGHHNAHSAVCELTHGPKPDPLLQAAHECGVRACVNPRHLTWKTVAENTADRARHGTNVPPEEVNTAKLKWPDVRQIRALYATGTVSLSALGRQFGVTVQNVSFIVRGATWKNDPEKHAA